MRIIFLDMDGVVADFNTYVGRLLNRTIGWEGRDLTDKEWAILAEHENLYYKLPLIEESRELVKVAQESKLGVFFLTAIPRRATIKTAEKDKRMWLEKYFPGIPMVVGPYSKDKQRWAKPLDILVDDKKSNIVEWKIAGGIAIHHLGNYSKTINELKEAIEIES